MTENDTSICDCRIRPVIAPLPVPHKTASGTLHVAPLVLIDIELTDGIVGSSYIFAYAPSALVPLADLVRNIVEGLYDETGDPAQVVRLLEAQFRLLGNQGLVAMALSGVDMALWDAAAKRQNKPLCQMLGASGKPVRAYDSLGQMSPDDTAREVEASLERGFRAFKVKAGHPDAHTDKAVIRAIRKVAGPDTWVAIDFNQAFGRKEAIRRMLKLDDEGIAWIEEPVHATDLEGHAIVRSEIATPVQTGENWWGVEDMKKAIAATASDYAMPDAAKIGGVTGWREAARIAEKFDMPVASHLFVEISAHLMNATPTAMILEWFDIAGAIVTDSPAISQGYVTPSSAPGIGVTWDEKAIARISG